MSKCGAELCFLGKNDQSETFDNYIFFRYFLSLIIKCRKL